MNVNPDGATTLCCQSQRHIEDGDGRGLNLQTHSMKEIWNGAGMRQIRERMSVGDQLPHCDACFNNERYGRPSYRQESNRRWLVDHPRAREIEDAIAQSEDGTMPLSPLYYDLRLGNICNLKCTACKPLYSSQIERDPTHSQWITDAPYRRLPSRFGDAVEWSEAEPLVNEILEMSGEISRIQLAGGEPTINKTQIALLRSLCESGRAQEIDLVLVTNLSNVRDGLYEIFAQFRSLLVALSIDGTGPTYEYVRFPAKWQTVMRNIRRLREICPKAVVAINAVLQAVNALNILELVEWADEQGISINISVGRGLDHYNDFRILPPSIRERFRSQFRDYFVRKGNRDVSILRQSIQSIHDEMDATDISDDVRRAHTRNFMQFVNDMDKSRKLSFKSIAPEIYDDIISYYGHWETGTRYA